ncbi:MAG: hypothetical protein LBB23_00095 [Rickettsiales bacterium]|nr:hypothetical protein [Rickettsiales bacterium]
MHEIKFIIGVAMPPDFLHDIITTTPSAYASLRRDTPSPAKGTLCDYLFCLCRVGGKL